MTLWFIQCDDGGENYDLFVEAPTRADATAAWINYYEMDAYDAIPVHRIMDLSHAARDAAGVLVWDLMEPAQ